MATSRLNIKPSPELPEYVNLLEDFLHRPEASYDGMLITELDGYLAGIVVSADLIPPSEWMPLIWGTEDGEPVFDDEAQAQSVIGAVMNMYNDTCHALKKDEYAPLYDMDRDDTPIWEIWLEGFFTAFELRQETWINIMMDEGENPLYRAAATSLIRLHHLSQRHEEKVEMIEGDDVLLKDAADIIPGAVVTLYEYRNMPPRQSQITKKKIGRNDPCPCGSGKKYKKCCLKK